MQSKSWPLAPSQGIAQRVYSRPSTSVQLLGGGIADFANLYWTQPWCHSIINKLVRSVARLPLKTYEWDENGSPKEAPLSPPAKVMRAPYPRAGAFQLKEFIMGSLAVYGNATLVKFRGGNGQTPVQLWPMPFQRVTIIEGRAEPIIAYSYAGLNTSGSFGQKPIYFLPEDVVHFTYFNPDGHPWGRSPLEALATTLALENAGQRYALSSYGNAARPASFIVSEQKLNKEQREHLRAEIDAAYGGPDNAFKIALLDNGLDWKPIGGSMHESGLTDNRKLSREEVCGVYDIAPPLVGILDHATYCLPYSALVSTEVGPKPIGEIVVGDRVWSHAGDRWELQRVVNAQCSGIDPILRIKTQNRTIEANAKHPILVRRLIKKAGVATSDDAKTAAGQSRWHYEPEHTYVPAGDLRLGDVICTLDRLPANNGGAKAHPRSVEMMEFFGLFIGDGNLMRAKGKPVGVVISRGAQASYMDHYRETMAQFTGRDGNVLLDEQPRSTRFASVSAATEMDDLGFGGTAHTKRVPGFVFESSEELRLAFLRGYLDADGSVDKKGRISFSSCNGALIEDVRHLCMGVGVPVTNVREYEAEVTLPDGRPFLSHMFTFTCSDPGQNRRIGSHTPHYVERMEAGKPFGAKGAKRYPFARGRFSAPPAGMAYAKVVSIEELDAAPVFDIEVQGTSNFVADGVSVHNSNISEQHVMLYMTTIAPILSMMEDIINAQFTNETAWSSLFQKFDMSDVIRGDFDKRTAGQQRQFMTGTKTPNELRVDNGDSPFGDPMDKENPANWLYVPVNTAPIDQEGRLQPLRNPTPDNPKPRDPTLAAPATEDVPALERDDAAAGAAGATGASGASGPTGVSGATGATGTTGATAAAKKKTARKPKK